MVTGTSLTEASRGPGPSGRSSILEVETFDYSLNVGQLMKGDGMISMITVNVKTEKILDFTKIGDGDKTGEIVFDGVHHRFVSSKNCHVVDVDDENYE